MDVRLGTFIVLAKMKSYTLTAEVVNITQPAVSQHIKFLEEYYGAKLVEKSGKEIKLTREGNILLKYAQEIESLYTAAQTEIKNMAGTVKTYNIGASMTIGGYVLPQILARYRKIYKNHTILLQVHNTEEILEKLVAREIDIALVEGPFDKSRFKYKKMKDDELVFAVSPEHDLAKQKQIDIKDIISGNLILREKGSGTRKIFEDKLLENGCSLQNIENYMEIGSISAIKSLVESNLGYTVISRDTIKKELEFGTIKVVPIRNMHIFREYNFVYTNEQDENFINEFIDFCLQSR